MGWQQLLDIAAEARDIARDERTRPPVACPNDGEPLQERDGLRNCPWGEYRWPEGR